MNRKETMDFINEVESSYPVSKWEIDGIKIWPLVRVKMASSLDISSSNREVKMKLNNVSNFIRVCKNLVNKFFSYFKTGVQSVWSLGEFISKRSEIVSPISYVFLSFPHYRALVGREWINKFADPLADFLESRHENSLVLELSYELANRSPIYKSNRYINFNFVFLIYLFSKIPFRKTKASKMYKYSNFLLFVEKTLHQSIAGIDIRTLKKDITFVNLLKNQFRRILKNNKVKICFINCYYHTVGMALSIACRGLGIPAIDVQHGSQGEYHVGYGNWKNIPQSGYSMMPTKFWCWSPEDAKSINKWASKIDSQIAFDGGNPFLEMWFDSNNKIVSDYDKKIKLIKSRQKSKYILFTLQHLAEFPPDWVWKAINQSHKNWVWWIRVHPVAISRLDEINRSIKQKCPHINYEIKLSSSLPLPALLRNADLHVTMFSSAVLEAANFSVPSIILSENGHDIYKPLIRSKAALFASSPDLLLQSIMKSFSKSLNKNKLFRTHSLEKTFSQLARLQQTS